MTKIYIDEGGDLGWTFSAPYRSGGSSRHLTIAYLIIPSEQDHIPARLIRETYNTFKINPKKEKKGCKLTDNQKDFFCSEVVKLLDKQPNFQVGAITVKKENVQPHIREDSNNLYNYMIRLAVLEKIKLLIQVELCIDNRTIKVKSGNSCVDYLQTTLWFELDSKTKLIHTPTESHVNNTLLFVDWITYLIWSKYENGDDKHFEILHPKISIHELLF